jgi:hypothetical protein
MARKSSRRVETAPAEVEAVGKPGMGIDEGIVLTTFFLLAIAIALVVIANQTYATAAG